MASPSIVVAEGVRTPMAEYNGLFADMTATDLAVVAAQEALRTRALRAGRDRPRHRRQRPADVARRDLPRRATSASRAGVPQEVPAVTVNRLCGSGFEALVQAKHRILLGEAEAVLAGGTENMSQAPFVVRGARTGLRLGQGKLEDSLMSGLFDTVPRPRDGADRPTTSRAAIGITREEQDAFALESQKKAADALGVGPPRRGGRRRRGEEGPEDRDGRRRTTT